MYLNVFVSVSRCEWVCEFRSVVPSSALISGGTDACVMTAGDSAKLSTAPKL